MKRKEALFALIGGVVGAVLVMVAGLFSPLRAHNEVRDAEYGAITCTSIKVLGNDKWVLILPGTIGVGGEDSSKVSITVSEEQADLVMRHTSHNGEVEITAREDGAGVFVVRNDNQAGASITAREDGGEARVSGDSKSQASPFPRAYVKMGINENGGHVSVRGKGIDEARAVMAVNEYGNGAISTWDKSGYRLATLK